METQKTETQQTETQQTETQVGFREKLTGYRQWMEGIRERMAREEPNFDRVTRARTLMALVALASLLMPWARIDGYTETMSGAELLAFAFTSAERGAMFRAAPLGAIALLLIPFVLTITACYNFLKNLEGEHPLGASVISLTMPPLMLFLAQTLTASNQPQALGITIPNSGVIIMMVCNLGLLAQTLNNGPKQHRPDGNTQ